MTAPTRPPLRYHGGKWRLAPWIVQHMPVHRVYVEPYGGAASVLLRKPRSHAEIYNDLDDDVVNLFRVLRCEEQARELRRLVALTPFARVEFDASYLPSLNALDRAHRLIVRSAMGYGSNSHNVSVKTGFRSNSNRSGTTPARDWANFGPALEAITARLQGVVIEHREALDLCRQHDTPATLHYLDPPYMHETRSSRFEGRNDYHGYQHELTYVQHAELLEAVHDLVGMVMISGYSTPLYDAALVGWHRETLDVYVLGNSKRTEVLWMNRAATRAIEAKRHNLLTLMQPD